MSDAQSAAGEAAPDFVGRPDTSSLQVENLFNALPELATLTIAALERGSWTDAFLLAAGMGQLVDEHLQRDTLSLRRLGAYLSKAQAPALRLAARAFAAPAARLLDVAAGIAPGARRARALGEDLAPGLARLAELTAGEATDGHDPALAELRRLCEPERLARRRLPRALRSELLRLPACFRSFDQDPEDMGALVRRFAARHEDRRRPLLVVGVRTSGSYLAPLCRAYLHRAGYEAVETLTLRPGGRLPARERALIRACVRRRALVLLCDDPPQTGAALAAAGVALERLGVAAGRIVPLVALFSDADAPPAALARYEPIVLQFEAWAIHRRLAPEAVAAALASLLGADREPPTLERVLVRTPRTHRGHLRALYRATPGADGESPLLSAEGVGLGYLGRHALAVLPALEAHLPPVFGVRDGLLLRVWLPDEENAERLPAHARGALANGIARYVRARERHLTLARDISLPQGGRFPAWEAASTFLSRPAGRAWPLARALVVNRVVKRVLAVASPCVIDGSTDLSRWFAERDGPRILKVDWDQGGSSNLGLACSDAVFDLAGVVAHAQDGSLGEELRAAYEALGGNPIAEERWLLHQLAHLAADPDAPHARRAASLALQRYLRRVYLEDLEPSGHGPLCGIDLDGVLEADWLGFPSLTPASALALRALLAHGYRPLIATGRSLGDVVERCASYRLAGGVAEYGAVIYEADPARRTPLAIRTEEQDALARLRLELGGRPGVSVDPDFGHAVRASVAHARRRGGPLPANMPGHAAGGPLMRIDGYHQTDFVAASVDKGRGLVALAEALSGQGDARIAFAVGDSAADAPMLALADRAFVPAHAGVELRERFSTTRAPFQRGLAEAVGRLIGHAPGACPSCRLSPCSRERRQLLGLLGMRDGGLGQLPWRLLRLAVLA